MKRCTFGFDCGAMFLQPGLLPKDCPNLFTCKGLPNLAPDVQAQIRRVLELDGDRTLEIITIYNREAARLMLLMRGNSQTPNSLGAIAAIDQLQATLAQIRSQLDNYGTTTYIAPVNVEAHTYSVKRPSGSYQYNKLTALDAIFEPSERTEKVKVIHLSHDRDPRNQEAKAGIERRNKLLQLTVKLNTFEQSIGQVLANLDIEYS